LFVHSYSHLTHYYTFKIASNSACGRGITCTKAIPFGSLGRVEDIAYAALFLSSKEAGFITGQSIIIDGGQTLPEDAEAF